MVALLALTSSAFAQTVYIINNTDYTTNVTVYGYAPVTCSSGGCGTTYTTSQITIYELNYPFGPTTYGPVTPCDIITSPGWSYELCAIAASVWCPSAPSDFQWTYATIAMPGAASCWTSATFPLIVGDGTIGCSGATTLSGPYPGCGGFSLKATWSSSGGDVTIDIEQY